MLVLGTIGKSQKHHLSYGSAISVLLREMFFKANHKTYFIHYSTRSLSYSYLTLSLYSIITGLQEFEVEGTSELNSEENPFISYLKEKALAEFRGENYYAMQPSISANYPFTGLNTILRLLTGYHYLAVESSTETLINRYAHKGKVKDIVVDTVYHTETSEEVEYKEDYIINIVKILKNKNIAKIRFLVAADYQKGQQSAGYSFHYKTNRDYNLAHLGQDIVYHHYFEVHLSKNGDTISEYHWDKYTEYSDFIPKFLSKIAIELNQYSVEGLSEFTDNKQKILDVIKQQVFVRYRYQLRVNYNYKFKCRGNKFCVITNKDLWVSVYMAYQHARLLASQTIYDICISNPKYQRKFYKMISNRSVQSDAIIPFLESVILDPGTRVIGKESVDDNNQLVFSHIIIV